MKPVSFDLNHSENILGCVYHMSLYSEQQMASKNAKHGF